ncbi:MAG: hypothetical protein Ta2B_15330 [Termitinemataceae bacterium]|nr:MAG: hypothetical protein Ta2B_15330 [Termitinemataceae bacterium]
MDHFLSHRMKNLQTRVALIIISLFLIGCATNTEVSHNKVSKNRAKADKEIAKMNEALAGVLAGAKEIIGSAEDKTVLHKDIIHQNAQPGDYLTRQRGDQRGRIIILTQEDIDWSKTEVARMNEELLDEEPESVRALLDEIIDEDDVEFSGEPTDETEIPYEELSGRVMEYVSDIRNGKQIVLIVANKKEERFFDKKFPVPPWYKSKREISPALIAFTLAKKVTSTENKVFSFNEDIEGTKKMIKEVKKTPKLPPPPPPLPPKPPRKPILMPDGVWWGSRNEFNILKGLGEFGFGYGGLGAGAAIGYKSIYGFIDIGDMDVLTNYQENYYYDSDYGYGDYGSGYYGEKLVSEVSHHFYIAGGFGLTPSYWEIWKYFEYVNFLILDALDIWEFFDWDIEVRWCLTDSDLITEVGIRRSMRIFETGDLAGHLSIGVGMGFGKKVEGSYTMKIPIAFQLRSYVR